MNRQKVELLLLQNAGSTVYNAGSTVYNASYKDGSTIYTADKTVVNAAIKGLNDSVTKFKKIRENPGRAARKAVDEERKLILTKKGPPS